MLLFRGLVESHFRTHHTGILFGLTNELSITAKVDVGDRGHNLGYTVRTL